MDKKLYSNIIVNFLKGVLLGITVIIPGLSVGTMMFVLGIYDRVIYVVTGFFARSSFSEKLFIGSISMGGILSVVILSPFVLYLLKYFPTAFYSLLTGFVVASTYIIFKEIKKYVLHSIAVVIFIVGVWFLLPTTHSEGGTLTFYMSLMSGVLAGFFSILPGVSGSLALVLLGTYQPILTAIHGMKVLPCLVILIGALIGSITALYSVRFFLQKNKELVFAIGFSFIVASLFKIFPWWRWTASHSAIFCITSAFFIGLGVMLYYLMEKFVGKIKHFTHQLKN